MQHKLQHWAERHVRQGPNSPLSSPAPRRRAIVQVLHGASSFSHCTRHSNLLLPSPVGCCSCPPPPSYLVAVLDLALVGVAAPASCTFQPTPVAQPRPFMAEVGHKRSLDGDDPAPLARKKMKLSDLPLTQAQRSAIDNLVHTFRKKGEYDSIRSLVRAQYEADVSSALRIAILTVADLIAPSPPKPLCSRR